MTMEPMPTLQHTAMMCAAACFPLQLIVLSTRVCELASGPRQQNLVAIQLLLACTGRLEDELPTRHAGHRVHRHVSAHRACSM